MAGVSKDTACIAIERVIKDLNSKVRGSGRVEMAIPGVGVLNIHDGIVAVAFDEALSAQSTICTNKHWNSVARKKEAGNFLTSSAMEKFQLTEV